MNFEKVSFAFFIVFALTLNFGFFTGEIDNPAHHHVYELFAAIVISLIATVIKLGDRSHIGAGSFTSTTNRFCSGTKIFNDFSGTAFYS